MRDSGTARHRSVARRAISTHHPCAASLTMLAADERTHHQCAARHHAVRSQQKPALYSTNPSPSTMQTFLDMLNQNGAAINLFFSLAVAAATVFYAVLTNRLVSETRRMREAQTDPALTVTISPSEHGLNFINLTIANVGGGLARDIKLTATPNFQRFDKQFISELGMFKHGIKYLAPGQRLTIFLTSMFESVHGGGDDLGRLNFVIQAQYSNAVGASKSEDFPIHFDSLEGFGTVGTPPLVDIARSLDELQSQLSSAVSGFKKLQVVVFCGSLCSRTRRYTATAGSLQCMPLWVILVV